jgi:TP901 family phage tail tape measure protein
MAKLNVILEARGRDRGARKQLRDLTRLADGFTEAAKRATSAGAGMGSIGGGPVAAGGRRTRGGGGMGGSGPRRDRAAGRRANKRVRAEREFDKALNSALQDQRAVARSLNKQDRAQRRAARNIKNLTDEQLVAVELEREQNRRRRRMARQTAQGRLGADPSAAPKRGAGRGRLEMAENLAVAGGEFEQFGDRVEEGIRGSFDAFSDFEKSVTEVSTLTDDISIDQIREITTGAVEEFGGLPTDQVKAFYSIVSAGATDAADATEQLRFANKLAIGGVAESEEAVLAISKSVANFGDQFEEGANPAEVAADSLFTAVKRGQTTVAEMARALPMVAQAASDTGLSIDETNAAIAVLSTRFPSAKEGATALRQALSNIAKPTKGARDEAKKLGIDFSTAGVQAAGGLEEFLLKLRAADKFDENTLAKLFDSTEARASVSALISGMDDYRSVLDDMESKQGAADTAFAKMSETSAQKAKKLEAQWELLKISAGEALVPALTDLAEELGPIIKDVTEWIKDNPKLAGTIAKVAIGVAVFSRGIGIATSALSMYSTLSGLSALKTADLGGAATKTTGSLGKLGGKASSLNLAGPIIAATAAIAAFEIILNQAQKPLAEFEQSIEGVQQEQADISFDDKSEEQLALEARNRQVKIVNAARKAASESRVGGVGEDANLLQKSVGGFAGLLNVGTGVTEDLQRTAEQAEADLAAIDARLVAQGALTQEEAFTTAPTVNPLDPASIQRLIDGIDKVAENTAGERQFWQGPSMEAGATAD